MAYSADTFRSTVVARRDNCVKFQQDKPAKDRKEALQFYRGDNLDCYGDSGDGLSTVVSRDTMEAVESMMPSLVKPFVASEDVVRFEPTGPEDEDGADQATDYINHVFGTHNNAFRVVHDAMKDGLLYRLGVAKTVAEDVTDGSPERYEGLSREELQALQMQGREIVGDIEQDEQGLFAATIAPEQTVKYRVHVIAPDEFLYEEKLSCLDDATFLAHRKTVTLGDLIEMGIERKVAISLSSGEPSEESDERFPGEDAEDLAQDDLARRVIVDECYIKCDRDKTGVLSWRKVLLGGSESKLLSDEEADDHPYSVWTPVPVPHKLAGLSIHDLTRDIQMNKTAITRELNNAMYLANRPMRAILEGRVNLDDATNPKVGGLVRVKEKGAIENLPSGGDAAFGASFQAIEYYDNVREARTGVTRYNQGMDTDSLNKTATGMSIIASASQQRQELVARQFAEFMKDIFRKLLRLVSLNGSKREVVRLRGKWVEVDPSDWKTGYDMTVSVGLGTNNKQQLIGNLMQLIEMDKGIIELQQGVDGPLVSAANVYEKLKKLVEAMDLKGIEKYYTDPAEAPPVEQPQEQQPDPLAEPRMKAETEIAKAEIKAATDVEIAAMKQAPVMGMPL